MSPVRISGTFTLIVDMWDDYHFKTSFYLYYGTGTEATPIGAVKIATFGHSAHAPHTELADSFSALSDEFFSLGQDREYYEAMMALPDGLGLAALGALRDVAADPALRDRAKDEAAFEVSLLRSVPLLTVVHQFHRIVTGSAPLTPYRFTYWRASLNPGAPELDLEFLVEPGSTPPTNVHVVIGANGVGKSRLLRDFAASAHGSADAVGRFRDALAAAPGEPFEVPFANVVHVAYSAFDRSPSAPEPAPGGTPIHAVGLSGGQGEPLDIQLEEQFARSFVVCSEGRRRERWLRAIHTLSEADSLLADADLPETLDMVIDGELLPDARAVFAEMSSGHKIVILTMTRLVELVEERSLILIDEPETHLHPPLLSAFTRALSDLVVDRNAAAIIATHSPVVLQEVPNSCVWAMRRSGDDTRATRLPTETFGESVSRLTSEVFYLDANRTGFNALLRQLVVAHSGSADKVLSALDNRLGSEGRFILSALANAAGDRRV